MKFGKYPYGSDCPTAVASYNDGYDSGREWDARGWTHVPGGPFIMPEPLGATNADWLAYCAQTRLNHAEWMRGWHDGRRDSKLEKVS